MIRPSPDLMLTQSRAPGPFSTMAIRLSVSLGLLLLSAAGAAAQMIESGESPLPESVPARSTPLQLLRDEARLYLEDSVALVKAPFHWSSSDWLKAGAVGLGVGGIMLFDEQLTSGVADNRSASTDRLSRLTTRFGSADAFYISGALVISGIAFKNTNVSSMGREAIEASVFAGIIEVLSKEAFGRKRPIVSGDETSFQPGSSNQSFPSGHATEAFTLASVVAARSSGWIIPTLAYTGACLVAYDRVNDRAHFPSDVVAGAALGIAVGRFVVHRHRPEPQGTPATELQIVPVRNGAGLLIRF
jgi:membrane-associated phospholipid phosphatase